ncbi:MAG: PTS transporter subunit EIIA [Deltaproteobacteria bacterium]|nr:PTS transporter subunit EIIA [Deltaproteobacteria bacterium]
MGFLEGERTDSLPRLLNLDQAAALLKVPVNTLLRWSRQGKVATRYKEGRMLFPSRDLEPIVKALGLTMAGEEKQKSAASIDFVGVFQRGGLVSGISAETKKGLFQIVERAPALPVMDKDMLVEKLLEREALAPTVVAPGIAMPHPRRPLEGLISESVIVTAILDEPCLTYEGGDVKAQGNISPANNQWCIFLLLSKDSKEHLQLLTMTARLVKSDNFISRVRKVKELDDLLEAVREELVFG